MHISPEKIDPRQVLLKGLLDDCSNCFRIIYAYLNEGDKVCECYSCLKMMIQAHLYVGFFTIFFIKPASIKRFYLSLKLLQSRTIFKQKGNHEVSSH